MTAPLESESLPARIWEVLAGIDDPEMPISIVDLGIVVDVAVDEQTARVRITPTFTGCPALDFMNQSIREEVSKLPGVEDVAIEHVFEPPWSVERISDAGRRRLREHGVTVPGRRYVQLKVARNEVVHCPYCASPDTRLDSPFGPTRCRTIYYCQACHNPFEHLKAV